MHLKRNNIISKYQFGAVSGKSVTSQLLSCVYDWSLYYDDGCLVDIIYFDFSKAFDRVSHPKLIHKLLHCGINGLLLSWLKSYLTNRWQCTKIKNSFSKWEKVTSGVPQGSSLGPILFLIYINDLVKRISYSKIFLFVDDIKIYFKISNLSDRQLVQNDINNILSWADEWQMSLAFEKCFCLSIGHNISLPSYHINNLSIKNITTMRDLGVILQSNFKFHKQIDLMVSKATHLCSLIIRNFSQAPIATK